MKVKRTFLIIGLLALATSFSLAQSDTGKPEKKTTFGLEAAVVPNILGGYHGSVVVGYNQWHFSGVFVGLTTPNSLLDDGF
jgi:hypothetical protein